MKRPRILFVSPVVPFPPNRGTKIRVAHLLRGLCDVGHVDAVCYAYYPRDWKDLAQTRSSWPAWWNDIRSFHVVRHPTWPVGNASIYRKRLSRRPIGRKALLYGQYPIEPLRRRIKDLGGHFDLVWVERLYMALAMTESPRKMIVDLDDLESVKMRREAETLSPPSVQWALRREAHRLARAERDAASRFAHVAVCSRDDLPFFENAAARVWLLPNGVDDALLDLPALPRDPEKLVFVGTLNYEPNQDAIRFFFGDILPRVRSMMPNVSVSIVGWNPVKSILDLHDGQSVFVYPTVPDVAPFVQGAALSIVPLRVGGGTRIKILESLALGTPVVSTTIGAEGLDLNNSEHLLIADGAAAFADTIVGALRDTALRRRLAEAGRRRVEKQHLWSSVRHRVAALVERWLAERRRIAE